MNTQPAGGDVSEPRCIGFGERDSRKPSPAKHCTNVADTPAKLWCSECEAERRKSISASFAAISSEFGKGV
jgi:hypothetical protein